jgi:hypothetical protein
MLEQLRHPPKGFEEVIRTHFAHRREPLLVQLSAWLAEEEGVSKGSAAHLRYLSESVTSLQALLANL